MLIRFTPSQLTCLKTVVQIKGICSINLSHTLTKVLNCSGVTPLKHMKLLSRFLKCLFLDPSSNVHMFDKEFKTTEGSTKYISVMICMIC